MSILKQRRVLHLTPPAAIPCVALLLAVIVTFFLNRTVFFVELGLTVTVYALVSLFMLRMKQDLHGILSRVADALDESDRRALAESPLPVVVSSAGGEILWYNDRFRSEVLMSGDVYGESLMTVTGGVMAEELGKRRVADIVCGSHSYTAYTHEVTADDRTLYVIYYVDNTHLKQVAGEYTLSRPAVVLFYIDNMDELLINARDSERAQISSKVESLLEDWASSTTGLLRRYASDRFMMIVEQRHLQTIIDNKFDILDRVRSVQTGERAFATLSVGVGQGETLRESERLARQAIDMALGRGGDQAAVKTKNGFDFYGGVSRGVEKRTKVRTRVVASALQELIAGSDCVLVMGHRYSDLDCLGSAAALTSCIRGLEKPAYTVVRSDQTLAPELMERYTQAGRGDLFIEPHEALDMLTRKSLLIITDTHNPRMLESADVFEAAATVVVIDHHRKMVEHIDNAVIFYHEPYASSASEMVAELVQYLGGDKLSRLDAEAMLAGIMLDTRSFVLRAGVRTFEAAAFLRRLGADTVEVKRLFSGSMDTYKEKADIVASALLYHQTAIAGRPANRRGVDKRVRIAAAQAADELLYIQGVDASFVLFEDENGDISVSARSLGGFNVQLVMEALGGGGHLTMAGAQLSGVTMEQATEQVMQAVDRLLQDRARSAGNTGSIQNG